MEMNRRDFLKIASLFSVLFAAELAGCKTKPAEANTIESASQFPDVLSYYPELKNFDVYSHGEFQTLGVTTWYNLTPHPFNPEAAAKLISFYEQLSQAKLSIDYYLGQTLTPFFLHPRPRHDRVIFIIPETAPDPSWPELPSSEAATTGSFPDGPYVTFIRTHNSKQPGNNQFFNTPEAEFQLSSMTEACQSTIIISSVDTNAANLGQEITCNSLGAFITAKSLNIPYSNYQSWAKTTNITPDQVNFFNLVVFPEALFKQIPSFSPLIKISQ